MKVRIIGAIVALLVAIAGTVVVVLYVRDADVRAAQGAELVPVYVVTKPVPEGSTSEVVQSAIDIKRYPRAAIQPDRVTSLSAIRGLVTNVALLPGDQLVAGRFSDPAELAQKGEVPVPDGMQQISLALPVERVVGGEVTAGSKVGIVVTLGAGQDGQTSQLALNDVLVTRVQAGSGYVPSSGASSSSSSSSSSAAAVDTITVSVAVSAHDATTLAWVAEAEGKGTAGMWLTLQNDKTDRSPSDKVTGTSILP